MNFNQFKNIINNKIESCNKTFTKVHDHELGLIIKTKLETYRKVKKWMDEVK